MILYKSTSYIGDRDDLKMEACSKMEGEGRGGGVREGRRGEKGERWREKGKRDPRGLCPSVLHYIPLDCERGGNEMFD